MHLSKRIALGLLLWPIAEVAAFLLVAWAIGMLPTLALMILTSLAGVLVLRRAGRRQIVQARASMRAGGSPVGTGVLLALAGILLVLPGFITDLLGAGLLIAPLRRRLGATIGRALGGSRRTDASVVDLPPTEWRRIPDRDPPRSDRG